MKKAPVAAIPSKNNNQTKIDFWRKKIKILEEEDLPQALQRIGNSATDGDWHENAEYEDAERQVELIRTRMAEIKALIKKLEKGI